MDSTSTPDPRNSLSLPSQLPRAYAVRSQRERLLEAMVRVAAARGYATSTVGEVVELAGISRETFDEMFESKKSCFLEAYDAVIDVLLAHVSTTYEATSERPWPERIGAALRALVELLGAEAEIARMAMVEVAEAGDEARGRYRAALARFSSFLEEGRDYIPEGNDLPPDTARFAIGGAVTMISDEIRAGRGHDLPDILPNLVFAVLVPYVGAEEAEQEMRRVAVETEGPV